MEFLLFRGVYSRKTIKKTAKRPFSKQSGNTKRKCLGTNAISTVVVVF